jgi:hypothetical protein
MKRRTTLDRVDLAAVALLGLCYVGVALLPFAPKQFGDRDFHVEARTLASAVRGATPWSDVAVTKAPGPVLYYAIPYLAIAPGSTDDTYWRAAVAWTVGWMAVALLLIRRTAAALGGDLAGRVAVLLTLASPFSVYYSYGVVAEPPAFLGAVLLAYGWARWRQSDATDDRLASLLSDRAVWFASVGLSLLVLSRPNAVLTLPLAAGAAAMSWLSRGLGRRHAAFAALCLVSSSVAIAAALGAASGLPGRRGETRQIGYLAHTTFPGRFQYRTEPWDWRFWSDTTRQGSADYAAWDAEVQRLKRRSLETGVPLATLQFRWMAADVLEHPFLTMRMSLVRLASLHLTFVNSAGPSAFGVGPFSGELVYSGFHTVVNAVNLLCVVSALCFLSMQRPWVAALWPLWAPWLGLLVFHVLTYAEPRYLFGARPGQTILAATALAPLVRRYTLRHHLARAQQGVAGEAV